MKRIIVKKMGRRMMMKTTGMKRRWARGAGACCAVSLGGRVQRSRRGP